MRAPLETIRRIRLTAHGAPRARSSSATKRAAAQGVGPGKAAAVVAHISARPRPPQSAFGCARPNKPRRALARAAERAGVS